MPVNLARAMGADFVIAVDVNYHVVRERGKKAAGGRKEGGLALPAAKKMGDYLRTMRAARKKGLAAEPAPAAPGTAEEFPPDSLPGIFELMLASVNIMETRITQSRLAVEPADLLIRPPLGSYRFLDFDRAEEIIAVGYESARAALSEGLGG